MLRPVTCVPCWAGLQAGFELQLALARWLCDPATIPASVTEPAVRALHADAAVKDWLWSFLHPRADQTRLLQAAASVASHNAIEKQRLIAWLDVVSSVFAQFNANPPQWAPPPKDLPQWSAFEELMLAFYEKLDTKGLPFDSNGQPTAGQGVTYKQFVQEFKAAHGDRVCVLCGGHLGKPQVDHWVWKANYPILSIAPDNLLPMCHQCNEPPGKGSQPVFALGVPEAFQDWFHPHHRPGHGRVAVRYEASKLGVVGVAVSAADNGRTSNVDKLLKLSERWTSEFKAEYKSRQKALRKLIEAGYFACTTQDLDRELGRALIELVEDRPHYHVHKTLLECVREPTRLAAWVQELA